MINPINVARYFIIKAYEDGIEAEMINMKVQKLLYYAQSLHLALYDESLFDEEIQAWRAIRSRVSPCLQVLLSI